MRLFGRRFDSGRAVCLEIAGDKIAGGTPSPPGEVETGHWPWVAPGFVDIQINGYGGQEFSSPQLTPEKVEAIVRVVDLETGRSIVVRINDRGPFVEGRIIDLSKGAAEKLGMVERGIIRVGLRIVRWP